MVKMQYYFEYNETSLSMQKG